jgi:hypothetical protein
MLETNVGDVVVGGAVVGSGAEVFVVVLVSVVLAFVLEAVVWLLLVAEVEVHAARTSARLAMIPALTRFFGLIGGPGYASLRLSGVAGSGVTLGRREW